MRFLAQAKKVKNTFRDRMYQSMLQGNQNKWKQRVRETAVLDEEIKAYELKRFNFAKRFLEMRKKKAYFNAWLRHFSHCYKERVRANRESFRRSLEERTLKTYSVEVDRLLI